MGMRYTLEQQTIWFLEMCTVSKVSYRYYKTDTSIVSKWQINDTFNDTDDDINNDRASLPQKMNAAFFFY